MAITGGKWGELPLITADLKDKVAVVSGASRNIGRSIAVAFAASGAAVAVLYRDDLAAAQETCAAVEAAGGRAVPVQIDLGDIASCQAAAAEVLRQFGRADILVNNAAIRPRRTIAEITPAEWDQVHAVNLKGPFFLAQALIPAMRERGWGRIINISGLDAYHGKLKRAHVVASKLGLVGLSRALANELARTGITVNAIIPGTIDTEKRNPAWYPDLARMYEERTRLIPVGRLGKPDEVAAAALFLASPEAAFMTGQELFVSGGAYPLWRQSYDEEA